MKLVSISTSIIIAILLASTVLAASGCFLDPNSNEYCQDLELTQAEQECGLSDECQIDSAYAQGQLCQEFDECELVLCQSTCDYEVKGLCESGEVPQGEEDLWCQSEGCCRYYVEGQDLGCQIEENKWRCHIAAKNANAQNLNWDQLLTQSSCEESCLAANYPHTAELETNSIDYYFIQQSSMTKTSYETDSSDENDQKKTSSETSIVAKLFSLLAPLFLLFIMLLLSIFFYEHRHTIIKDYKIAKKLITKKNSNNKQPANNKFPLPPSTTSTANTFDQLSKLNLTRKHFHHDHISKRHHAKLEFAESFAEYGSAQLDKKSNMSKLEKITKKYDRKTLRKLKNRTQLEEAIGKK